MTPYDWVDQFGRNSGRKDFLFTITTESYVHYLNPAEAALSSKNVSLSSGYEFYISNNCNYYPIDKSNWGYTASMVEAEGDIHPAFLLNFDGT